MEMICSFSEMIQDELPVVSIALEKAILHQYTLLAYCRQQMWGGLILPMKWFCGISNLQIRAQLINPVNDEFESSFA